MRIIVDAMGGDNAPEEIVKGCVEACRLCEGFDIILVGDSARIEEILSSCIYSSARITIKHTTEVIETGEPPVAAIKKKKDSSMVVGLTMLREGSGDAFISAGSTGALLSGALLRVGRIRGILRPALAPFLPNGGKGALLIDCGANMDCKSEYLEQFALMGSVYLEKVFGFENPRVGLVNVGAEPEKGNELAKDVHRRLANNEKINFVGNIEGRDIFEDKADIAVCDGFAGNLILKTVEGAGLFIFRNLKKALTSGLTAKLAALALKKRLMEVRSELDYTEYGGAPLLGIDDVVVKAHGSSDAKTIRHTVLQAVNMVRNDIISLIKSQIENLDSEEV